LRLVSGTLFPGLDAGLAFRTLVGGPEQAAVTTKTKTQKRETAARMEDGKSTPTGHQKIDEDLQ